MAARVGAVGAGVVVVALLLAALPVRAETIEDLFSDLLAQHRRVEAAESRLAASVERARVSLGDWFPDFNATSSYGYEEQRKGQGAADTSMPPRELTLKITQLLWDFGAANAGVRRARLQIEQEKASLAATRQGLLLEGVQAYTEVLKARQVLQFAEGSVENIRRQTELEDSRVQRGSGFSTDVLQAKTQLAAAMARRVRAQDALRKAVNRFRNVFYQEPTDLEKLGPLQPPTELLPADQEAVLEAALENNPQLTVSRLTAAVAREDFRETRADKYFPKINGILESSHKRDFDGTIGGKQELLAKVELTYDLDLGLADRNAVLASGHTSTAAEHIHVDTRDRLERQVRDLWQDLETARANAAFLRNQADIAGEFLELARKERQLGRRSLIDVLSGETALITASSDAAAAEADVVVAVYRLVAVMGQLKLSTVH